MKRLGAAFERGEVCVTQEKCDGGVGEFGCAHHQVFESSVETQRLNESFEDTQHKNELLVALPVPTLTRLRENLSDCGAEVFADLVLSFLLNFVVAV